MHAHGLEVGMVLIGQGRVHLMHGHGVHAGHLVLLLPLHPPVLEPDLDLSLCETESVSDLYPPAPREISVEVELLLQLQGLVPSVGLPASLPL